jgi:hypothetical protein
MNEIINEILTLKFLIITCGIGLVLSIAGNLMTKFVENLVKKLDKGNLEIALGVLVVVPSLAVIPFFLKIIEKETFEYFFGISVFATAVCFVLLPLLIKNHPNYEPNWGFRIIGWSGPITLMLIIWARYR